jgi:hypothetical protein
VSAALDGLPLGGSAKQRRLESAARRATAAWAALERAEASYQRAVDALRADPRGWRQYCEARGWDAESPPAFRDLGA